MFDICVPRFDVNDNEVVVTDICAGEKDYVNRGSVLFKVESTKMVKDILAEEDGYIHLCCNRFDKKQVGEKMAVIFSSEEEYQNGVSDSIQESGEIPEVNITAKARELAKGMGVDIQEVAKIKGSNIIKTADIKAFANKLEDVQLTKNSGASVPMAINIYDRERVIIIGAGRLSEQVIDILLDDKDKTIVGLVDSYKKEYASYSFPLINCSVYDFPDVVDRSRYDTVIIALGGDKKAMKFRKELYELYKNKGIRFTNAIGDNVNIRRAVKVGENNIIMHNCYIGTGSQIGDDNMISYGTCIGHHCIIGSHNLFAPGFMTPGSVRVGNDCIIMTGVNMINYTAIGSEVVLPVGCNVVQDIPDGTNFLN